MRKRALAGLACILALAACGEARGLRFATGALAAETDRLVAYYFEPAARCSALWTSSDRSQALHGPFASEQLDAEDLGEGFTFPSRDLPTGTYVVVVDALGTSEMLVGSGCAEAQQVLEQRSSFTEIVIYPIE